MIYFFVCAGYQNGAAGAKIFLRSPQFTRSRREIQSTLHYILYCRARKRRCTGMKLDSFTLVAEIFCCLCCCYCCMSWCSNNRENNKGVGCASQHNTLTDIQCAFGERTNSGLASDKQTLAGNGLARQDSQGTDLTAHAERDIALLVTRSSMLSVF